MTTTMMSIWNCQIATNIGKYKMTPLMVARQVTDRLRDQNH